MLLPICQAFVKLWILDDISEQLPWNFATDKDCHIVTTKRMQVSFAFGDRNSCVESTERENIVGG